MSHVIDRLLMLAGHLQHGEAGCDAVTPETGHLRGREGGLPEASVIAVDVGTIVRPGRVRNRTKTEPDEKVKKPADGLRKKSPPARKAPARGRYVDEYARPAC